MVEGGTGRATAFLPSRDTLPGEPANRLGAEDAEWIRARLGLDAVRPSSELTAALAEVRALFTPMAEVEGGGATRFGANDCARRRAEEEWDRAEPRHRRLVRLLKERFPAMGIEDACPALNALRTIKSPAEIAVLRQAGRLAANALIGGLRATRPGITENRLQAVAEYVFRDQGIAVRAMGRSSPGARARGTGTINGTTPRCGRRKSY